MAELKNKAVNLEVLKEAYKDLDTKKANKTDISVPYKFRGNCTFASLPTSGNEINDTFYVTDEKCKYSWNGTNWYQSSLNETDYLDEFNTFKGEVNNEVSELKGELSELENDFYYDNSISLSNYVDGQFTTTDKTIASETTFRYYIIFIPVGAKKITITNVMCGGSAAVWIKENGSIKRLINYKSNKPYDIVIDVEDGENEIWFTTRKNVPPTVVCEKESKYATIQYVNDINENKLTENDITTSMLNVVFPDENIGFTTPDPSISYDSDCRYSSWLKVRGGEIINITNALMTGASAVQILHTFNKVTTYQITNTSQTATFDMVLPNTAIAIRYSVLASKTSSSKVSYITDYKEFRNDFIPSLYVNGLETRNDYPIVTFVDDDGQNAYLTTLKPLFDSFGVKGTVAMITNNVDRNSAFLTLEQLNELKADGYDIVSHSHSHREEIFKPTDNANVTEDEIYNDLITSRQWLDKNGFNSECIVFPFGFYRNKTAMFVHQAIKAGFQFGCDAGGKSNNDKVINTFWLERSFIYNTYDFSKYKALIDECVSNNGWLILSTHCYSDSEMGDLSIITQILQYLSDNNISVKTFKEASDIKKNVCSIGYIDDKSNKLYIGRDGKIYN